MRKTWFVVASLSALMLSSAAVVQATLQPTRTVPLDRQVLALIPYDEMHVNGWLPVGGWAPSDGPGYIAEGGIAVTLSVTLSGAPAEFRVVQEVPVKRDYEYRTMRPGIVRFDPGDGTQSFSFTFVAKTDGRPRQLNLWWRSPTSTSVQLHRGTVVIQYGQA
jgi:hypothetical protein